MSKFIWSVIHETANAELITFGIVSFAKYVCLSILFFKQYARNLKSYENVVLKKTFYRVLSLAKNRMFAC